MPSFVAGLVFSIFCSCGGPSALHQAPTTRAQLAARSHLALEALIGAALGALFIYGVGEIYFRLRHIEGMGLGDVKLMAMVGAFLGAKLALFTIFTGALPGSIFGLIATLAVWRKRIAHRRRRPTPNLLSRSWTSASLMLRYYEVPFGVFWVAWRRFHLHRESDHRLVFEPHSLNVSLRLEMKFWRLGIRPL